jgi:hypothetical protein
VNGPLQQRTNVLDSDSSSATTFPDDYDTDLDSAWSNPSKIFIDETIIELFSEDLLVDGNDFSWASMQQARNTYYQKQLANQITNQVNQILSLLTATLNIHLNVGQNSTMNTSEVFMSLETKSMASLANKVVKQVGNAQIQLPSNFNANLSSNSTVSIRVRFY